MVGEDVSGVGDGRHGRPCGLFGLRGGARLGRGRHLRDLLEHRPSSAQLKTPEAIAPVAPDDIWVVGNKGLDTGKISTGVGHWDGAGWTLFPTPNAGSQTSLVGADALGSDDVWAVGYYTSDEDANELNTGFYKTLVQHWDDTGWQVVASPNVGQYSNTLADVDAVRPDLAWAVGYYRPDKSHRKLLILRWDGADWRRVPAADVPSPGTLSNSLLGVAAVDDNGVWAVGYMKGDDAAGYRSLVLHHDGASWTEVDVQDAVPAAAADNVLTSISAAPGGDVWAAGYYVDGTQHKTLTLHYDGGSTWTHVPSANEGGAVTALRGIDASSPTDAWAVGIRYQTNENIFAASTQHWDGSSWTTFPPAIGNVKSEMLAVGKAPGTSQVWAAGRPANVETICLPDGAVGGSSKRDTDTTSTSPSSPTFGRGLHRGRADGIGDGGDGGNGGDGSRRGWPGARRDAAPPVPSSGSRCCGACCGPGLQARGRVARSACWS